jgi:inosine-uridine nucleoside N-ribohydrolase
VIPNKPAHEFIRETVRAAPGGVILLAVGPLTNLALALEHEPALPGLVRKVVVMGGAFGFNGHAGNVSPCAEFNIASDPHAADRVFTAPWPVEIVGLDVTQEVVMSTAYLDELGRSGGEAGRFMREITRFYERHTVGRARGIFSHDATAAACALDPGRFEMRAGAVRVVTEGIALGQTIQSPADQHFPPGAWDALPQQKICTGVDSAVLLQEFMALWRGSATP